MKLNFIEKSFQQIKNLSNVILNEAERKDRIATENNNSVLFVETLPF